MPAQHLLAFWLLAIRSVLERCMQACVHPQLLSELRSSSMAVAEWAWQDLCQVLVLPPVCSWR